MIDKLMALLALAVLIGFLGILIAWVPRLDLGLVVGATVLLVVYDFLIHERKINKAKAGAEVDSEADRQD